MTGASRASGLTFDTGALIAVERGDERIVALIRAARRSGLEIAVPAGALAQAWRDGRRQARLAGLLRVRAGAPQVVALDARAARSAGELCGRSGTADVIDASVLLCALARGDRIVTSDPGDMRRLDPAAPLIPL